MSDTPLRTRGREYALRLLYAQEISNEGAHAMLLPSTLHWWTPDDGLHLEPRAIEFGQKLWFGVQERQNDVDRAIQNSATHWRLERISPIERNLLRIGVYEILYCDDIPLEVTISEMVNLAKHYGDDDAGAFVNGILDAVAKQKA